MEQRKLCLVRSTTLPSKAIVLISFRFAVEAYLTQKCAPRDGVNPVWFQDTPNDHQDPDNPASPEEAPPPPDWSAGVISSNPPGT